jgi:hypothetical protein
MKNIFQKSKYKLHQLRRSKRNARRKRDFDKISKNKNKSLNGLSISKRRLRAARMSIRKRYPTYAFVSAPTKLSFRNNTEEVAKFMNDLSDYFLKKRSVFVQLRNVTEIDYDAIVVLLAKMVKFKSENISFNGDFPYNKDCKNTLIRSGFFNELVKDSMNEKETYNFGSTDKIYTHAFKRVDSIIAKGIIRQAAKTVWGAERRIPGVYRIFMEAMQNTNNHAVVGKPGEKHWWLSVNHDRDQHKVRFSFLDFGVGVFRSLENKPVGNKFHDWAKLIYGLIRYRNNADLMRAILNGEFHSTVTGKHFRGKGLPGIAETFVKKQVNQLVIITNNVLVDLSKNEYRLLNFPFEGTFIYWEIDKKSDSLPVSI